MKLMAGTLKASAPTMNVSPNRPRDPQWFRRSGGAQTGNHRLEFWTGFAREADASTVDAVEVKIHGVTSDESFGLTQGIEGLKCVLDGSIDGAPCSRADYYVPMTAAVAPLDARMTDLSAERSRRISPRCLAPARPPAPFPSATRSMSFVRATATWRRSVGSSPLPER